jgi:methyl-accepting chemotaxis protein
MRCTRQYRKVIIIPFFICVMSLLYALSLFLLFYEARANNAANMGRILVVFVVASCAFRVGHRPCGDVGVGDRSRYRSITGQLDQLSSAEKDLGKRISVVSVDELGTISGLVNDFCEGLYVSVKSIKEAQGGLLQLGEELRQGAANAAVAVERITSGIKTVREKSRVQADSVSESSSAVEEIAKNIDSLETMIADQAASISEASASIEEMVSNISSVTNSIEMMSEQFSSLMRSADDGIAAQSDSRRKIDEISAASQTLLEANAIISSIASQTNLLAMNAAIEAAHAGEAGRGFSVVADEIRKLAETSSVQTKKISSEIKLVQRAIEEAVAASKGSEKAFSMVSGQIDKTEAIVREVKHAMIEQKEGSTQILEALRAMNELTSQVQAGSREMSDGNNAILAEITQLKKSTDEIMQSIEKISSGSEEVDRSMRRYRKRPRRRWSTSVSWKERWAGSGPDRFPVVPTSPNQSLEFLPRWRFPIQPLDPVPLDHSGVGEVRVSGQENDGTSEKSLISRAASIPVSLPLRRISMRMSSGSFFCAASTAPFAVVSVETTSQPSPSRVSLRSQAMIISSSTMRTRSLLMPNSPWENG